MLSQPKFNGGMIIFVVALNKLPNLNLKVRVSGRRMQRCGVFYPENLIPYFTYRHPNAFQGLGQDLVGVFVPRSDCHRRSSRFDVTNL